MLHTIDRIASNRPFEGPAAGGLSPCGVEDDLEGPVGGEGESPRLPGGSAARLKCSSVLVALHEALGVVTGSDNPVEHRGLVWAQS